MLNGTQAQRQSSGWVPVAHLGASGSRLQTADRSELQFSRNSADKLEYER
jgi:hypothetical protein